MRAMKTVIETPTFQKHVDNYWSSDERLQFIAWLAANPTAGVVVPGSGGVRKLRWGSRDSGKRGGVRVIYYNQSLDELIWLLTIYGKNVRENITPQQLRALKETIDDE